MEASDITFEMIKKNKLVSGAIIGFIVFGVLVAAIVCIFLYSIVNGHVNETDPYMYICMGLSSLCLIVFIVTSISFIIGLVGKSRYDKFIKEVGEDGLMNEINSETLYIYARKNKPITIITRRHIFELNRGIYSTHNLSYAYGYSYKGSTSIRVYTITNGCFAFANNIILGSEEMRQCFIALKTVNPQILLGFNAENRKLHSARVKEFKSRTKR